MGYLLVALYRADLIDPCAVLCVLRVRACVYVWIDHEGKGSVFLILLFFIDAMQQFAFAFAFAFFLSKYMIPACFTSQYSLGRGSELNSGSTLCRSWCCLWTSGMANQPPVRVIFRAQLGIMEKGPSN